MNSKSYTKWTDKELSFLKRNYATMDNEIIAEVIGRTELSLVSRARVLGLRKRGYIKIADKMPQEEIARLFHNGMTVSELAAMYQISITTMSIVVQNGLKECKPIPVKDNYEDKIITLKPLASENFLDYIVKMNGTNSQNLAQKLDTQFLSEKYRERFENRDVKLEK